MKRIDVDITRLPFILKITPVALPSLEIQPQKKAFSSQASGKYLFHPVAPFFEAHQLLCNALHASAMSMSLNSTSSLGNSPCADMAYNNMLDTAYSMPATAKGDGSVSIRYLSTVFLNECPCLKRESRIIDLPEVVLKSPVICIRSNLKTRCICSRKSSNDPGVLMFKIITSETVTITSSSRTSFRACTCLRRNARSLSLQTWIWANVTEVRLGMVQLSMTFRS